MSNVDFFTPLTFGDHPRSFTESLLEGADDYFSLGGKKGFVVPEEHGVVITDASSSCLMTALKVLSYATLIIPAIMFIAKAILRSCHTFQLINVEQRLQGDITVSPEVQRELAELGDKISRGEDDARIEWHGKYNNKVFSLHSAPGLVFKTSRTFEGTERRFQNSIRGEEVRLAYGLDRLVIPHTAKIVVDNTTFIVEEKMGIRKSESAQEENYAKMGNLESTVRQLTTFIAKTGFSDVEWRNIPLLEDRRVALIDIEEMSSSQTGIFGGWQRKGLVHCLFSDEMIDVAVTEAARHGLTPLTPIEEIKRMRHAAMDAKNTTTEFYTRHNIVDATQPLEVNIEELGLNLELEETLFDVTTEQRIPITLRQVTEKVIAAINNAIAASSPEGSLEGRRRVLLNFNHGPLYAYHNLGIPRGCFADETTDNQRWIIQIINALIAHGHLHKLLRENGRGITVQA